jgi:serine/threonine-protein kinase
VFDQQDSGNVSYGVEVDGRRFFAKTAGSPLTPAPVLSHEQRVELLRSVIHLHVSVSHTALVPLRHVVESPHGPILIFDWVSGESVGASREERSNPESSYLRFRSLHVPIILGVLDQILDLHRVLAKAGWVAVDFYDGSMLYDFTAQSIHVFDLDSYHRGPFVNRMGRLFGSTRFMAPEEFELGAEIDERTNVYMLGRAILELLSKPGEGFRASHELLQVAERACQENPTDRYESVAELFMAWRSVVGALLTSPARP